MELYLVRPGEVDASGGHTQNGLAQTRKVASFAARLGISIEEIRFHASDPASSQAADEFAQLISVPKIEVGSLGPDDDINPLRREAAGLQKNVLVISNGQYLSRIIGALLAQDESMPVVLFHPGSFVRLDRRDDSLWSLQLVMPTGVMP